MRTCPACRAPFAGADWKCAACGHAVKHRDGIPLLAPAIAESSEDFDQSAFELLREVEEESFWFRGRNKVVNWALSRFFPDARNLLEIGCGTGFVLAGLSQAQPALELTAGDASWSGLCLARERVPDASLLQLDARALPFTEEFDVVGAFDVLEHLDQDQETLASMRAATRRGGGIILTVPQHPRLWSANDEYGRHKRRYTRAGLREKLRRAGLELVRMTSFVSVLLPAMAVSRWRQQDLESFDPSAEYRLRPSLDALLERSLDLELALIRLGVSLPAGGSLLAVAIRK